MVQTMIKCGLNVECHHHEVATGGQAEIDMRFGPLLRMADDLMLYKYIIRNVANQYGKTVTFMPKPLFADNGSGMHCHQSLWKGGTAAVCRRLLRGPQPDGAVVYRRPAQARARAVGDHRADHQQLQAPGAGLRSAGEPGVFAPEPLGRGPHPDVLLEPEGEAPRVPAARSGVQPVPRFFGHADGGPRWRAEQDRSRANRWTRTSTICRRRNCATFPRCRARSKRR